MPVCIVRQPSNLERFSQRRPCRCTPKYHFVRRRIERCSLRHLAFHANSVCPGWRADTDDGQVLTNYFLKSRRDQSSETDADDDRCLRDVEFVERRQRVLGKNVRIVMTQERSREPCIDEARPKRFFQYAYASVWTATFSVEEIDVER